MIALGFAAIAALIAAGLSWSQLRPSLARRPAQHSSAVARRYHSFRHGLRLVPNSSRRSFIPKPIQPFWIAIVAGLAWAALAFTLFVWWSSRPAWNQAHRFATALGATLACTAPPYANAATWPTVDLIGKIICDILALAGFIFLAKKLFAHAGTANITTPDIHREL